MKCSASMEVHEVMQRRNDMALLSSSNSITRIREATDDLKRSKTTLTDLKGQVRKRHLERNAQVEASVSRSCVAIPHAIRINDTMQRRLQWPSVSNLYEKAVRQSPGINISY